MRLSGTRAQTINQYRGLGNQFYDLAGTSPSLDLTFADSKSLVDATTGQNLVTFTRASSGTYVDSQGVIRTATTNLLLRSEEFDSASWTKSGASITANNAIAPNGLSTADQLVEDTSTGGHLTLQSITATNATTYTFSVYLKKSGRRYAGIVFSAAAATLSVVGVDFDNGQIVQISGLTNATGTISSVGNGWFRVSATTTSIAAGAFDCNVRPFLGTTWNDRNYTGDGTSGIYLWGAQLEQSSTVGEYIPTTSTINSAPRFDHNPTTGESLGLLVEEQRTNLLVRSEDLTSTWLTFGTTVTANATTAPDGTTTADKLVNTTANVEHGIYQATTTSGSNTFTVFAKQAELRYLVLRRDNASLIAVYDLQAGTVSQTDAGVTAAITAFPNGWYRCSMTCSSTGNTVIKLSDVGTGVTYNSTYTGTAGQGILIWGAQLEAGSFPTSYIPTTTATVTRSADVASSTGSNFSSWYRQDEGTVFVESRVQDFTVTNFSRIASLDRGDATTNFAAIVRSSATSRVEYSVFAGTGQAVGLQPTITLASGSTVRSAFVYRTNDFLSAANGILSTADTTGSVPTSLTTLGIGMQGNGALPYNGTIRRLTYWPRRLPNETLQRITQ